MKHLIASIFIVLMFVVTSSAATLLGYGSRECQIDQITEIDGTKEDWGKTVGNYRQIRIGLFSDSDYTTIKYFIRAKATGNQVDHMINLSEGSFTKSQSSASVIVDIPPGSLNFRFEPTGDGKKKATIHFWVWGIDPIN